MPNIQNLEDAQNYKVGSIIEWNDPDTNKDYKMRLIPYAGDCAGCTWLKHRYCDCFLCEGQFREDKKDIKFQLIEVK
jgi:uncharacterized Fe-S cluster-containing MiaB family protein